MRAMVRWWKGFGLRPASFGWFTSWTGPLPVTAHHIEDGASSDVWPLRLIEGLANWERYRGEVRARQIRVFRLDPGPP